ncbi:FHA domain-containing protein [Azonexus sp.]|uniref:FHA domain-containing protein n=1 Tax=Azonexus sp. TaxID=1872668 RepID=UPI0039E521F1
MAKLILSMDGLVLKEIELNKERLTIGRKPHNDIQIDNLAISGEHAVVVTILQDSFLEDLNSTNGTLVNGQAIKKHFLRNNDIVELGKYKLKYMADSAGHSIMPDAEQTAMIRSDVGRQSQLGSQSGELSLQPTENLSRSQAGVASRPSAVPAAAIQLLNGSNAGKLLKLEKTLTTLGKPGVQVAVIARRPHGYFLTHVEGDSYPLLNGKAIDAQAQSLEDHDVIEIAGTKMAFILQA